MNTSKIIVLGGGCFWCTEAVFSLIDGVKSTQPGYGGGTVPNPSYQQVCTGQTGHAEVTKVEYDPEKIPLEEILEIFFSMHDPTALNRQGNDVGEQYRSAIFYQDEEEGKFINKYVEEIQEKYTRKIVTSVEKLRNFYPAEDYHKDYFKNNPGASYCRAVISPKIEKIKHKYPQVAINLYR